MANSASALGQLQRSGVQRLVTDKKGRAREGGPGSGRRPMSGEAQKRIRLGRSQGYHTLDKKIYVPKDLKKYYDKGHAILSKQTDTEGNRARDHYVVIHKDTGDVIHSRYSGSYGGNYESKRGSRKSNIRESLHGAFKEEGEDQGKGKQKNRVYLCTVIEEGLGNSKDKNYYSGEALKNGAKVFEGAKAYADHPDAITEKTLPERSMKDLVGWYSNCVADTNPATGKVRLQAKIHFFPSAKWLTDMIDTVLTDPTAKNLFGISINAVGRTRPATMNGEEVNYVEEFQRVDSADVVTEPAARGKFEKMLESRRSGTGTTSGKVTKVMHTSRRTREAATLSPEKMKEVADALVSGYNSDNPDELKQSAFEAAKVLHAASSISGKGPGQVNEEQYSNINPSGGSDEMPNKKVKASTGKRSFKKGKRLVAAAGTGPDSEDEGEPDPDDIEGRLEEADVEDEEGDQDYGEMDDFGGNHTTKEAREGFEDEDEGLEGFEDEDEDENDPAMAGGAGGGMPGSSVGAPAGGGAPGSSRTVASAEAGDDEDGDDDGDDIDDMDESIEDEGMEDEDEGMEDESMESESTMRPSVVAEARNRGRRRMVASGRRGRTRGREADGGSGQGAPIRKASYAGGLGHSGHAAFPKGADPTRGYDDSDEAYGKKDDSTSGVGKSYKIKTSKFSRNRVARRVAKEANRRIAILEDGISRLRESKRALETKLARYKGIVRFTESQKSAHRLLREAFEKELLPEAMVNSRTLRESLYGLNVPDQIREIKKTALLLESAAEGTLTRLTENVEGSGARGSVVSHFAGTAGADSELEEGFADMGIPMKKN